MFLFLILLLKQKKTGCNASGVFVPPPFAADAILEAVEAELDLVVCITDGIPTSDMQRVRREMKGSKTRLSWSKLSWCFNTWYWKNWDYTRSHL